MSIARSPGSPLWTSRMLSVFRIVVGVVVHVARHAEAVRLSAERHAADARSPLMSLLGFAGVLEVVRRRADRCRVSSRVRSRFCSRVKWQSRISRRISRARFYPTSNGGESAVLFCFSFLYLMFAGAGAWSIDAMYRAIAAKRSSATARCHATTSTPLHDPSVRPGRNNLEDGRRDALQRRDSTLGRDRGAQLPPAVRHRQHPGRADRDPRRGARVDSAVRASSCCRSFRSV